MKKYRDEIAKMCHEIVKDGRSLGIIDDSEINEFEADCFAKEPEIEYKSKPVNSAPATGGASVPVAAFG